MALDRNERIIVEAIKRCTTIVIELDDPDKTRMRFAGDAPREIGNALQLHYNNLHKHYYGKEIQGNRSL